MIIKSHRYGSETLSISEQKEKTGESYQNNGEYTIDTTLDGDNDADDMYEAAKDLAEDRLPEEQEILENYKSTLTGQLSEIEEKHSSGQISDEEYNKLKTDCQAKISMVEEEYNKRENYRAQLQRWCYRWTIKRLIRLGYR